MSWRRGRVVRQRPAKPCTAVRIRSSPPFCSLAVWNLEFELEAPSAELVHLCLLAQDGRAETDRVELKERGAGVFVASIDGVSEGQLYGFRVHGPWDPRSGHLYNPNKLVSDPYAKEYFGNLEYTDTKWQIGNLIDDSFLPDERDSIGAVPVSKVTAELGSELFSPAIDRSFLQHESSGAIYEAHVKGATHRLPGVDPSTRGTYLALGSDPFIEHLLSLKVEILELMPIFEFLDEPELVQRGKRNVWGYNTYGFFAPTRRYAAKNTELSAAQQLRYAIGRLHDANIKVVLDVVYNHSAEGGVQGPTLSFRGIDNRNYYLVQDGGYYMNWSGTGNTFDGSSSLFLRLALDSMRYFVQSFGVDGFRLDLGAALSVGSDRGAAVHLPPSESPFYLALMQDPTLRDRVLIAEPWDATMEGQLAGQYPLGVSEWNGNFRDDVRRFWSFDKTSFGAYATRLCGSEDLFGTNRRNPSSSINFVTSHDGFTLFDLTHFREKNNYENGENNQDGSAFEPTCYIPNDLEIDVVEAETLRMRTVRSLIAALYLSLGRPMITYGDEFERSQGGNNNAYCIDSPKTWSSWRSSQTTRFVREAAQVRSSLADLFKPAFLEERRSSREDVFDPFLDEVEFYKEDGTPFVSDEWSGEVSRTLSIVRSRHGRESDVGSGAVLTISNPSLDDVCVTIPAIAHVGEFTLLLDSSLSLNDQVSFVSGERVAVPAKSLVALLAWKN